MAFFTSQTGPERRIQHLLDDCCVRHQFGCDTAGSRKRNKMFPNSGRNRPRSWKSATRHVCPFSRGQPSAPRSTLVLREQTHAGAPRVLRYEI